MRPFEEAFHAAGTGVLLVGMGTVAQTKAFIRQLAVPFPMVCDPEREIYKTFALKRISPLGFLSPALAVKGLAAMGRGHAPGVPQGDVRQLAGVFIIDTHGVVIFRHEARDPSDHPTPEELIDFLKNRAPEASIEETI